MALTTELAIPYVKTRQLIINQNNRSGFGMRKLEIIYGETVLFCSPSSPFYNYSIIWTYNINTLYKILFIHSETYDFL